jgi:hypothetical protein
MYTKFLSVNLKERDICGNIFMKDNIKTKEIGWTRILASTLFG